MTDLLIVKKGGNSIPLRQLLPSFVQWICCYTSRKVEGSSLPGARFSMKYFINIGSITSKVRGIVRNGPHSLPNWQISMPCKENLYRIQTRITRYGSNSRSS